MTATPPEQAVRVAREDATEGPTRACYLCRAVVPYRSARLVRHGERVDYVCERCAQVHRHGGHDE